MLSSVQSGAEEVFGEVRLPEPGRKLIDPAGRMLADALQEIDQIVVRGDLMQPTGDNQALHDPDLFGAQIGPAEIPFLPTELMNSGETSVPCCLDRKPWISHIVMPRVYMAYDLVVEAGEATFVLGNQQGLEAAFPVARNVDTQRPFFDPLLFPGTQQVAYRHG